MAQGTVKQKKPSAAKKSGPLGPQRGTRVIAPKKQKLIKQQKINKKISAGIAAKTEQALAARAGHLELLSGGKKSKKSDTGNKAKNAKK